MTMPETRKPGAILAVLGFIVLVAGAGFMIQASLDDGGQVYSWMSLGIVGALLLLFGAVLIRSAARPRST